MKSPRRRISRRLLRAFLRNSFYNGCPRKIATCSKRDTDRQKQRHRDTETQRHRDTETQRHRDTQTQKDTDRQHKFWPFVEEAVLPCGSECWAEESQDRYVSAVIPKAIIITQYVSTCQTEMNKTNLSKMVLCIREVLNTMQLLS